MRWLAAALVVALGVVFTPLPSCVRSETELSTHFLLQTVQEHPSLFQRARARLGNIYSHGSSYRPDVKWRHLRVLARPDPAEDWRVVADPVGRTRYFLNEAGDALAWNHLGTHVYRAPTPASRTFESASPFFVHWVTDDLLLLTRWGVETDPTDRSRRYARPVIRLFDVTSMSEVEYREERVADYVIERLRSDDAATLYDTARLAGELQLASAVPHLRALLDGGLDPYLVNEALDRIAWGDGVRRAR